MSPTSLIRSEGFTHVFEWTDAPGTVYEPHAHKDRVTVITTRGMITFDINGEKRTFRPGDRFDVPPGVTHSAIVGPEGWSCVVGEMIPGDS
jgi:quercetin dioxygenase-like cupin family protein